MIPRDEESAIRWLRQELKDKPRTFPEISPQFMRKKIGGWMKFEKPVELRDLLEENFLYFDGKGEVPARPTPTSPPISRISADWPVTTPAWGRPRIRWYVPDPNKLADLEKLRKRVCSRNSMSTARARRKD